MENSTNVITEWSEVPAIQDERSVLESKLNNERHVWKAGERAAAVTRLRHLRRVLNAWYLANPKA